MAVIGGNFLNLVDLQTSKADGKVIQALHQLNPWMQDAYMEECNNGTDHETEVVTSLGTGAWGRLYQGIVQSKGTTTIVKDTTGFVERLSTVDTRLLDRAKDPARKRMQQANMAMEWMTQEVMSTIFYGDTTTTPERFKGLSARYNALTNAGALSNQVVDGGGTGADNTSIWFVTHGEMQVRTIYPEGSKGGIQRDDKGEQRVLDPNGLPYWAKEEVFTQHVGISIGDGRFVTRIANIDVSDALAGTVNLYDLMRKAIYKNQYRRNPKYAGGDDGGMVSQGRMVIYMNSGMLSILDGLATNSGAVDNKISLTPDEIAGKEIMTWRGFPIRETDALINAEQRVV